MSADELRRLHAYSRWATTQLLDACTTLTPEQLSRPIGGSFGTLLGTLRHMVGAEWVWLERFHGRAPRAFPAGDSLTTVADLRRQWDEVAAGLEAILSSADPRRLVAYTTFRGDAFEQPLGDLLHHVANHATYHRGQVAMSLRLLGAASPSTGLVAFLRLAR